MSDAGRGGLRGAADLVALGRLPVGGARIGDVAGVADRGEARLRFAGRLGALGLLDDPRHEDPALAGPVHRHHPRKCQYARGARPRPRPDGRSPGTRARAGRAQRRAASTAGTRIVRRVAP
ncbi:hypothetical protein GCM10009735_40430 [Actinomadura chokoriensis]